MLKLFAVTAVNATLILVLPTVALTNPLSIISPFPVVPNSEANGLVCYMQTEEGQTINLNRLCVKPKTDSNNSSTKTDANGSSNNSIAARPCYLFDANGLPCSR